jgi:Uma2 family endonuclease
MTVLSPLLTAEEYLALPDNGQRTELVRGRVEPMNVPTPRHGEICMETGYLLRRHLTSNPTGRVVCNDAGVLTRRDPDTLRGADIAYYSFARVPPGPLPRGYLSVPPDLMIEVRSPTDRWRDIQAKVAECLAAGVNVVCVLDEQTETAHVFSADEAPRQVTRDEELTFPGILDGFRVVVRRFFEEAGSD